MLAIPVVNPGSYQPTNPVVDLGFAGAARLALGRHHYSGGLQDHPGSARWMWRRRPRTGSAVGVALTAPTDPPWIPVRVRSWENWRWKLWVITINYSRFLQFLQLTNSVIICNWKCWPCFLWSETMWSTALLTSRYPGLSRSEGTPSLLMIFCSHSWS